MLNRIVTINDKEYEIKYTNRARADLEGLEGKAILEIAGDLLSKIGIIKIETAVNLIYCGLRRIPENGKITRDDIFDWLPDDVKELTAFVVPFMNVFLEDTGITKMLNSLNEKKEKDNEGK